MDVSLTVKPCSMLFLSFYTHGFNGYLHDAEYIYAAYEDILKAMNSTDKLKSIPKVSNLSVNRLINQANSSFWLYNVGSFELLSKFPRMVFFYDKLC